MKSKKVSELRHYDETKTVEKAIKQSPEQWVRLYQRWRNKLSLTGLVNPHKEQRG
jgi:hypothetical protein